MIYHSMFPHSIFDEMSRLHRGLEQFFEAEPSIRGAGLGGFPAMNMGSTPQSTEIYTFAPGLDPDSIEVTLERGVLTVAGERKDLLSSSEQNATVHINERFAGNFRRVVSLPDDVDPDAVSAHYKDGVLHISIRRREQAQARRIAIH